MYRGGCGRGRAAVSSRHTGSQAGLSGSGNLLGRTAAPRGPDLQVHARFSPRQERTGGRRGGADRQYQYGLPNVSASLRMRSDSLSYAGDRGLAGGFGKRNGARRTLYASGVGTEAAIPARRGFHSEIRGDLAVASIRGSLNNQGQFETTQRRNNTLHGERNSRDRNNTRKIYKRKDWER